MIRKLPNYSKTLIYQIVCDCECYYVGSTTNFTNRKNQHKSSCNNKNSKDYHLKIYKFMRENGWTGEFVKDGWYMVQIEQFPCKNKLESSAREYYHYSLLNPSLNTQVPGRTKQETIINWNKKRDTILHKTKARINCPHCSNEMWDYVLHSHLKKHCNKCPESI